MPAEGARRRDDRRRRRAPRRDRRPPAGTGSPAEVQRTEVADVEPQRRLGVGALAGGAAAVVGAAQVPAPGVGRAASGRTPRARRRPGRRRRGPCSAAGRSSTRSQSASDSVTLALRRSTSRCSSGSSTGRTSVVTFAIRSRSARRRPQHARGRGVERGGLDDPHGAVRAGVLPALLAAEQRGGADPSLAVLDEHDLLALVRPAATPSGRRAAARPARADRARPRPGARPRNAS